MELIPCHDKKNLFYNKGTFLTFPLRILDKHGSKVQRPAQYIKGLMVQLCLCCPVIVRHRLSNEICVCVGLSVGVTTSTVVCCQCFPDGCVHPVGTKVEQGHQLLPK